jgi:hypothetical protein
MTKWIARDKALLNGIGVAGLRVRTTTEKALAGAQRVANNVFGPPDANDGFVDEALEPKFVHALIEYLSEADKDVDVSFRSAAPTSTAAAIEALNALMRQVS